MSHLEECAHGKARAEDCGECVGFESKGPAVDVERALYEALRAIVRSYDLGIFTKRDRAAMVEAIALYEAKGK